MARGGRRHGAGAARGSRSRASGIEKYGEDPVDEALRLHNDDESEANEDDDDDDLYAEEDVMAFESGPDGDDGGEDDGEDDGPPQEVTRPPAKDQAQDGKAKKSLAASAGWKGADFYGGDDPGDDSEAASDEGLILEEARKLEEARARRLAGADDPLAALLPEAEDPVAGTAQGEEAGRAASEATAAPAGSSGTARFESVFAAEAERASAGPRGLEQLPEGKRRGLLKREAPELPPLLEDFQAKLQELRELLPLLAPGALARLPSAGASYVRSKATLLLNTLANLSFYVLLRAEGGAVRTHPVVSQLVWLRELHQQLSPLDQKLAKQRRKVLRAVQHAAPDTPSLVAGATATNGAVVKQVPPAEEPESRPRPTIKQRIEQLRAANASATATKLAEKHSAAASKAKSSGKTRGFSAADLLRLPTRRGRAGTALGGEAEDLDEVDPVLGIRMPSTTLGEQISEVQQLIRERGVREKAVSADTDVMPRKNVRRASLQLDDAAPMGFPEKEEAFGASFPAGPRDDDEDELVKLARMSARAKKEKHLAGRVAEEQRRIARQDRPEEIVDGRRSTSKRILQNRGLVRHRKKQAGNARVANRTRYEKAVKRRKGAVQEMREGAADGASYGGEETGIRTHLKKSQRLG